MQDLYKLYNAHIHDGAFDTATVRKAITWITIPSMLFWAWNNGDDDRKKIWNEMETWKKNLFWWIIIDKDFSIPIAKPFSLGMLYGSMPERFMDYWINDDKRTAEGFATTLAAQMLPSAIPLYACIVHGVYGRTGRSSLTGTSFRCQSSTWISLCSTEHIRPNGLSGLARISPEFLQGCWSTQFTA